MPEEFWLLSVMEGNLLWSRELLAFVPVRLLNDGNGIHVDDMKKYWFLDRGEAVAQRRELASLGVLNIKIVSYTNRKEESKVI